MSSVTNANASYFLSLTELLNSIKWQVDSALHFANNNPFTIDVMVPLIIECNAAQVKLQHVIDENSRQTEIIKLESKNIKTSSDIEALQFKIEALETLNEMSLIVQQKIATLNTTLLEKTMSNN